MFHRAAALDHFVVEGHVLDVERDVLLRLQWMTRQLLGAHLGQADLLDDDGVAREPVATFARLDLVVLEHALDRVDHRPRVHDRAVHDRLGGSASMPMFRSWNSSPPLPPTLSSTALTAEEPMSTPTSPFFLPKGPRASPLVTVLAPDSLFCASSCAPTSD